MKWNNIYQFKFTNPVVLVIDMQNEFCHEQGVFCRNDPIKFNVTNIQHMIPKLKIFLDHMRKRGIPIIYCKTLFSDDAKDAGLYVKTRSFLLKEGLRRNDWGSEIVDDLYPLEGDYIVEKSRFSAFYNTNMEIVLRALKAETLFFTGVATNVCVESTIRDAFFRDYQPVLIEDCCRAWKEEAHLATINNVLYIFGMVMNSEEIFGGQLL